MTATAPTRTDRVTDALAEMGQSIFYGGFSTFLGMLVLGFASSAIFFIFFRMFFGIIAFGLAHGLLFIPVLLSLVGPRTVVREVKDVRNPRPNVA